MKTTEQIKSEVINYLNKTSQHTFINKKGDFYKILLEGDFYIVINGDKVTVNKVDDSIRYHDVNTKCVIKQSLFLIPSLSSIFNAILIHRRSTILTILGLISWLINLRYLITLQHS